MNARFGDLSGRGPLGLKGEKPKAKKRPNGKDPAYIKAIHDLPCCICDAWGFVQKSPTQAHHTIFGRYSQRKTPDRQAIPLCWHHHQGPDGVHTRREWWEESFGPDTDWIAGTQDKLAHLLT